MSRRHIPRRSAGGSRLIAFSDGGHLATLTVDGVTLASRRLLGVPDLGAAGSVRTETVGLWCEEAGPAAGARGGYGRD